MDAREKLRRQYQDELVARSYDEERDFREEDVSPHYEAEILALRGVLKDVKGPILEVAVGTGRLCRRLKDFGSSYVGIDVSMSMLKEAQRSLTHNSCGPFLIRADSFQMPFREGHFEAVIGFRFIKHLEPEERKEIYGEINRVLKRGGLLIFDFYGWRRRTQGQRQASRLTVKALRKELEENNFRLLKVYGTRHLLTGVLSAPFKRLKVRAAVQALGWLEINLFSKLDALIDRSRGGIAVSEKT